MVNFRSPFWLGHDREFIYGPRGFKNIYDHDKTIIRNWNKIVNHNDDVYVLGDIMLNNNDYGLSCLKQLKGKIHIIRGNHDSEVRMELYKNCHNVVEVSEGQFLRYGKYHFYLSHYPTLCANYNDGESLKTKIISLCGHVHTKDKFCDADKGVIYHCELDANENKVKLLDEIIEELKEYYK